MDREKRQGRPDDSGAQANEQEVTVTEDVEGRHPRVPQRGLSSPEELEQQLREAERRYLEKKSKDEKDPDPRGTK